MILVDTSIWGTFARVNALEALFDLFGLQALGLTPTVLAELRAGADGDAPFLNAVTEAVEGGSIRLVPPTPEEILAQDGLPSSFGSGERESIAVCRTRRAALLSNDKRARNFCRETGIAVYDVADLLRALWLHRVRTRSEVRQLLEAIEAEEQMVFRNRDAILARLSRSQHKPRRNPGRSQ
ncbi:MAG: hypothetical protein HY318_17630 [Armatimonadetes bacterium]|nr:hypothetical protein [Armatimonadota bacterium]